MFRTVFILSLCISVVFSFGEVQEVDGNDAKVQNAIRFAMDKLNAMSNNYYLYMPIKTRQATKQVVEGLKYCAVVVVGSSKCPKRPEYVVAQAARSFNNCPVEKKEMECGFVVWERVWLEPSEQVKLIEHKCSKDNHLICSGSSVKIQE